MFNLAYLMLFVAVAMIVADIIHALIKPEETRQQMADRLRRENEKLAKRGHWNNVFHQGNNGSINY